MVHAMDRTWGIASSSPQDRKRGYPIDHRRHQQPIQTLWTFISSFLHSPLPVFNLPLLTVSPLCPPSPPIPPQYYSAGSTRQHLFQPSVQAASRWCYWVCSPGCIFGSLVSKRLTVTEECHHSTEGVHQVIMNCQQRIITECMWKEKGKKTLGQKRVRRRQRQKAKEQVFFLLLLELRHKTWLGLN